MLERLGLSSTSPPEAGHRAILGDYVHRCQDVAGTPVDLSFRQEPATPRDALNARRDPEHGAADHREIETPAPFRRERSADERVACGGQ